MEIKTFAKIKRGPILFLTLYRGDIETVEIAPTLADYERMIGAYRRNERNTGETRDIIAVGISRPIENIDGSVYKLTARLSRPRS